MSCFFHCERLDTTLIRLDVIVNYAHTRSTHSLDLCRNGSLEPSIWRAVSVIGLITSTVSKSSFVFLTLLNGWDGRLFLCKQSMWDKRASDGVHDFKAVCLPKF